MLISSPFPSDIGFHVCVDSSGEEQLFPEEQALLTPDTHPHRVLAFTLGRSAAHAALRRIGVSPQPILPKERNQPDWPAGVRGSISHTMLGASCVAVAAAGKSSAYAGIGLDIEPAARKLSERLAERISRPDDRDWALQSEKGQLKNALKMFSAKEALFKAFFPLYPHPMSYQQAELHWNEAQSRFEARIHLPQGTTEPIACEVEVREAGEIVLTAVALPQTISNIFEQA